MPHVHRHQRITRGRAVTVRAHERAVPERHGTDTVWDDGTWDDSSRGAWDDQQDWGEPSATEDAQDWTGTRHFRHDGFLLAEDPDGHVREVPERGRLRPEVQQALDGMKDEMREWRSKPEPQLAPEPMTPQMEKLMGCDTPGGREQYERLRAYRESGYHGPLGPDNRIPDPDDPDEQDALEALACMRANS